MGKFAEDINNESIDQDIDSSINRKKNSNDENTDSLSDIRNQEENPDDISGDSTSGQEGHTLGKWTNKTLKKSKGLGKLSFVKKKGPLALITAMMIGTCISLPILFSPGILIVQLKEVLTSKFNNQFASMDIRSTKLLVSKMSTTKGVCTSVITVKCKYSSMSDKQIKNFEKAGITVVVDLEGSKGLTGRSKVKGFTFKGKTILANGLNTEIARSTEFRSALHKAYNPKYAGFSDKIWSSVSKKLKISKTKSNLDGDTAEAKLKKVQEQTSGTAKNSKATTALTNESIDPATKKPYEPEALKAAQAAAVEANKTVNAISNEASDITKSGVKSGPVVIDAVEGAAKAGTSKIAGVLGINGFAQSACTAYGSFQALGTAAKTIRAAQLAAYAMIFLNVADQIKAGTAKSEDVAYLGTILTTELITNGVKGKSATDSYGYKYAAYGDTGKMATSASQYLTGGGLTGELIGVSGLIKSATNGTPKKVCKIVNSTLATSASLVAGIALMLIPGVDVAFTVKDAAQAVFAVAVGLAAPTVAAMLADIVAGVVIDKTTVGESSGDAVVSGASKLMGDLAGAGGNSPLTSTQAVEYADLTKQTASLYAEEDRLAYSPLDISNGNTFLGSIVSRLVPYTSKMSSLSGIFSSVASLSTSSLAFATSQTTKAVTAADYEMCQDFDYNDLNGDGDTSDKIATDPYCNVIYGIPPSYLNKDPIAVSDALGDQIDQSTGDPKSGSEYATFVTDCINRDRPFGDAGADLSKDDGGKCIFNANNANYYLHYIDQRVDKGMDGMEMEGDNSGGGVPASATIDTANLYKDSTSVGCAVGTTPAGSAEGWTSGEMVKINLCSIPNTTNIDEDLNSADSGQPMKVNSRVSGAYLAFINGLIASTGKSNIQINSAFRTPEMQQKDIDKYGHYNGSSGAAGVGYGPHQMGIAVDYYTSTEEFLNKYGLTLPTGESWHIEPKK